MTQMQLSMMKEKGPEAPCRDCESLRLEPRSFQGPHEYLVISSHSEATGESTYTCLVCRNKITQEWDGEISRWK